MKALSIRQPWCHHILQNGKDIENRSWPTKFRGTVLVHASKKVEDKDYCKIHNLDVGGIVGMIDIVDCVSDSKSNWYMGEYGFVLERPRPLPLIPCKGALGFFSPDITTQVVNLWFEDALTEGQGSKILGMDIISFRKLLDEAPERPAQ